MRLLPWGAGLALALCLPAAWSQEETAADGEPAADTIPVEPVRAQPEPAADAPAEAPRPERAVQLDAVEVTAQRRTEKLQNVPIAVTAITSDQVAVRGIERIDDLNSLAPGLQVSRSPSNSTISQLTMRGSSQINPAIYWDPAVGVYLDGVFIGKAQGSIFNVVDLARVEVLRGPQGTLYGRNTIGGTINLITREPSGNFSGNAAVELGNYDARVLKASLDLPRFGDFASLGLGLRSERRDGWVETTPGSSVPEMNNRHNDGLHLGGVLDLADNVEGIYHFDFGDVDQTNIFDQLYRSDDPTLQQYVSKERQKQASVNAPSLERSRTRGHSLTLAWDVLPGHTLKSITGQRKVKWTDFLDLDGSPEMVAHTKRFTDYDQFSQDLQYSFAGERSHFTGGLFYFTDDGYTNNPQTFLSGSLNFDSRYGTKTKAWAGYGQFDWTWDQLVFTGGLRYTHETKSLARVLGVSTVPGSIEDGSPQPGLIPDAVARESFVYLIPEGFETPDVTFTDTTPLVTMAWIPNDQVNLYLRYAEGFKSGGYNGEYSTLTGDTGETPQQTNQRETNTPFRPEQQRSLELGLKMSGLENRALAHLAVFRNKLVDLQASIFLGGGSAAATVVRNAGKATVNGVELETAFVLWPGTQLRANYAWLDAKYDEFIDGGENVADNRAFVHAPEHAWNVVLDSELLTTRWGAVVRATVDYVWTDRFYTYPYQLSEDPNPPGQQKQEAKNTEVQAYGLLNARLALNTIPLGRDLLGELALWGRNLLDADEPSNFIDFGPGAFQNLTVANFVEPRALGISGALRW
jgi:iron complex outermembrane recepter protein